MVGLIWREWRAADPIMNLKLFKFRNFAVCALLMILVGGILNATTVLQPQFSPGAFELHGHAGGRGAHWRRHRPAVRYAAGRVRGGTFPRQEHSRYRLLRCFAAAFYYTSTHLNLGMSFGFASWLRIVQGNAAGGERLARQGGRVIQERL